MKRVIDQIWCLETESLGTLKGMPSPKMRHSERCLDIGSSS